MLTRCQYCGQEIKLERNGEGVSPFNHFVKGQNPIKHNYLKSMVKQFNDISISHYSPYRILSFKYKPECSIIVKDDDTLGCNEIKFPNIDYMTDFVKGLLVHMQETIDRL